MPHRARGRLGPLVWMLVSALSLLAACTEDPHEEDPTASEAPLARDIDIALVELNQGVAIPLAQAGEWIDPDLRSAPIVMGRDALVRVYWSLGSEFESRPITARLTLERPGVDEPIVQEQTMTIAGEAGPERLEDSFNFELRGEELVPGVRFAVSLHEVDADSAELAAPSPAPITPRDGGTALVGVRPEPTQMELVLVPIQLQWPGCSTSVDLSEVASQFDDAAFMKSPTRSLTTRIREEPLVITSEPSSIVELLGPLARVRTDDQADTRAYYYGLYEACGSLVDDLEGVAPIATPDPAAGWLRVGVGSLGDDPQHSAEVFIHQLGHLQGLGHVDCPGVEAIDPDPGYPHAHGSIGVWGLGLRDHELHDPGTAHDFMSSCYAGNWSSDWTWAKIFERISTVSSWDRWGGSAAAEQDLLLGWIADDGREHWWSTRGRIPIEMLAHDRIVALAGPGALLAARLRLPDAGGTLLGVELPDEVPEHIELVGSPFEIPNEVLVRVRSERGL